MKSNDNAVVYSTDETVNGLNKVKGFNPMKYARNTEYGAVLDLPYQKLWFRLKHPNGRIRYFIQKLSDSVAAVEARVFFDRRDSEPIANHIVSGVDITDKNAVSKAQRSAAEKALSDAGFGLQFISENPPITKVIKEPEKKVVEIPKDKPAPEKIIKKEEPAAQPSAVVKPNVVENTEVENDTMPVVAPDNNTVSDDTVKEAPKSVVVEVPDIKAENIQPDPLLSVVNTLESNGFKVDGNTGEVLEDSPSKQPDTSNVNLDVSAQPVTVENENTQSAEATIQEESKVSYDKDTPVEEICKVMTLEDAMNFVIEGGPFNGMKMETLSKTRPAKTFDTIIEKYPTKNNILKAAATIVRDNMQK